jgi:hypothetical protein
VVSRRLTARIEHRAKVLLNPQPASVIADTVGLLVYYTPITVSNISNRITSLILLSFIHTLDSTTTKINKCNWIGARIICVYVNLWPFSNKQTIMHARPPTPPPHVRTNARVGIILVFRNLMSQVLHYGLLYCRLLHPFDYFIFGGFSLCWVI